MNETPVQEAAPRVASSSASPAVDDRPVALELIDVRKHFGTGERRVPAVDGVDLSIRRGEVVALLGTGVAGALSSNGYAAWAWTDDDASFAGDVKAQNINFDGTLGVAAPDDVIFADGFDGAP